MSVKVVKIKPKTPSKSPMTQARADRWINPHNQFGGPRDPMSRTYFGRDYVMTQPELDALYEGDWVSRRIVEIIANDVTREWITLSHDTDQKKAEKVTEEMDRLNVQENFAEAIRLARLYGGDAMIIGAFDGQDVSEPLGTVESVEWIANVDRFHAYPATHYQDPEDPRFGLPETYTIQRLAVIGTQTMQVHESRIIRFDGAYLPPRLRIRNFGWSAPVIQHVREQLRQFGVSMQSGAGVLQDFITMKMKIDNLSELLRDNTGTQNLLERVSIIAAERAMHNIMLYGADEEIDKVGTPVTGLAELIDLGMDFVSAAAEIPKSVFFHNQTGRLGGDAGANDRRTHYDNISSQQENKYTNPMQQIVDIVAEPLGFAPGEIKFVWNPLWQLSELEQADQYNKTADGDVKYINAGVLHPEEVALGRFGGETMNLGNLTINTGRREKMLDALENEPIDLDDDDEPPDPDDPTMMPGNDPQNTGQPPDDDED